MMKLQFLLILMLCTFIVAEENYDVHCDDKKLEGEDCTEATDCCYTLEKKLICDGGKCIDGSRYTFGR